MGDTKKWFPLLVGSECCISLTFAASKTNFLQVWRKKNPVFLRCWVLRLERKWKVLPLHKTVSPGLLPGLIVGGESPLSVVFAGCQYCCCSREVWPNLSWRRFAQVELDLSWTVLKVSSWKLAGLGHVWIKAELQSLGQGSDCAREHTNDLQLSLNCNYLGRYPLLVVVT